jgi:phage baseplate assembly protein W
MATSKEAVDAIVGTGWSFPLGIDPRGRIALARGENDIQQAILLILETPQGQRLMRPNFGSRLHELVFAPNDAHTAGKAVYYARQALEMWEPRIRLLRIDANTDPSQQNVLLLRIEYEILATYQRRSLVYPFYRIPGDTP